MWPQPPWQARNQAAARTWYAATFGGDPIEPYRSVAEAVATWPEYATAVAVRLDSADRLKVCAPYGLTDLLGGVWRHNPARVDVAGSRQRLARHRPAQRWPGVTVIEPG
ncbi:nucleotidyltransferase family protein [Micromonospora ureilytica]|nr:nucleotidyltransferase family protein [Micromonospora ureilytica]